MKRLILLLLVAAAGCREEYPPIRTDSTENRSVPVALLFTKDGCNVYRFYDVGEARYFVTCPQARQIGEAIGGEKRSCGKGCRKWYESVIPTVAVDRSRPSTSPMPPGVR